MADTFERCAQADGHRKGNCTEDTHNQQELVTPRDLHAVHPSNRQLQHCTPGAACSNSSTMGQVYLASCPAVTGY
jgi:hypothetical protein